MYQESAPSRANSSTTTLCDFFVSRSLPQPSQKKTAIGTPQMRWREMHQSGRVAIMLLMRSSPQAGIHFTFLISSSARCRRVLPSTWRFHGDEPLLGGAEDDRVVTAPAMRIRMLNLLSAISTPRAFSSSMIG